MEEGAMLLKVVALVEALALTDGARMEADGEALEKTDDDEELLLVLSTSEDDELQDVVGVGLALELYCDVLEG